MVEAVVFRTIGMDGLVVIAGLVREGVLEVSP